MVFSVLEASRAGSAGGAGPLDTASGFNAATLAGARLVGAAFGPANGASTCAVPFAAATALLAAVAILIAVAAARTTVARDVT